MQIDQGVVIMLSQHHEHKGLEDIGRLQASHIMEYGRLIIWALKRAKALYMNT